VVSVRKTEGERRVAIKIRVRVRSMSRVETAFTSGVTAIFTIV
jgi:hypothetical protein